jgi:hypothetical protein
MIRRLALVSLCLFLGLAFTLVSREPQTDPRLKNAARHAERNGWTFVHLEGKPAEVGFQHGYLLAPEIQDAFRAVRLELTHESKGWDFYREAAEKMLWPRIEREYREELQGMADGLRARGVKLDLWDIVAHNAWLELPYYVKWHDGRQKTPPAQTARVPERCSAFVATGSYTSDGRIVIGHNAWTSYMTGQRWNIIFDIVPASGHRILMDGMPGLIHSGDDFGMNAAGILITETTISGFHGFDPGGIAEFARARKAMQYSTSIDDFARIMQEGNNGGYANNWLVADRKNDEIASLELGLKNVTLERTRDGYYIGSNFPKDAKLAREETDFDLNNMGLSPNARRVRWEQVMAGHKGRIDAAAGQRFLADHLDTYTGKTEPSERTLCGHIELSPRGVAGWQPPYGPCGASQNKVADARMADRMSLAAAMGHACGLGFRAAEHLGKYPEFAWQKDVLRDLPARPWTTFSIQ